jgi:hypothetical protein
MDESDIKKYESYLALSIAIIFYQLIATSSKIYQKIETYSKIYKNISKYFWSLGLASQVKNAWEFFKKSCANL